MVQNTSIFPNYLNYLASSTNIVYRCSILQPSKRSTVYSLSLNVMTKATVILQTMAIGHGSSFVSWRMTKPRDHDGKTVWSSPGSVTLIDLLSMIMAMYVFNHLLRLSPASVLHELIQSQKTGKKFTQNHDMFSLLEVELLSITCIRS